MCALPSQWQNSYHTLIWLRRKWGAGHLLTTWCRNRSSFGRFWQDQLCQLTTDLMESLRIKKRSYVSSTPPALSQFGNCCWWLAYGSCCGPWNAWAWIPYSLWPLWFEPFNGRWLTADIGYPSGWIQDMESDHWGHLELAQAPLSIFGTPDGLIVFNFWLFLVWAPGTKSHNKLHFAIHEEQSIKEQLLAKTKIWGGEKFAFTPLFSSWGSLSHGGDWEFIVLFLFLFHFFFII